MKNKNKINIKVVCCSLIGALRVNVYIYSIYVSILLIATDFQLSNTFNTFLYYHPFPKTSSNIVRRLTKIPLSLGLILTIIKIKEADRWSTRANLYTNYYISEMA